MMRMNEECHRKEYNKEMVELENKKNRKIYKLKAVEARLKKADLKLEQKNFEIEEASKRLFRIKFTSSVKRQQMTRYES